MKHLVHALICVWLLACSKDALLEFEEPDPADVLYQRGMQILEGETYLFFIPRVNYGEAISTFQTPPPSR